MILYLRVVPGLWIAVEEQKRPELRSRPVIIGGLPGERGAVQEANVAAQRCGVYPGMTLTQAHQCCPEGLFLLPDMGCYETLWEEICGLLASYTPLVETVEMGQAVCDLSGCERRWRDAWSAGREIAGRIHGATGIAPWLGVASNRLVAQLASTAVGADGLTVVEAGQERAFLADLPITLLPDLDPRLALAFQVLGLRTIGQLAALPAAAVRQRFGAVGEQLHRYARGIDQRPVTPPPSPPRVSARHDCEEGTPEEAAAAIHRLADACAAELQRRHLAGRLVELTLIWRSLSGRPSPPRPAGGEAPLISLPPAESGGEGRPEGDPEGARLPIPYRIHSMLPQPGKSPIAAPERGEALARAVPDGVPLARRSKEGSSGLMATVRTAIDTPAPLAERAHQLLRQGWPQTSAEGAPRRLQALELTVSEFAAPVQQSFEEFLRLGQTGGRLSGLSSARLQALAQGEQILTARYGDASFRHVADVDPGSILTERRFRWEAGLPRWSGGERKARRRS